MPIWIQTYLNAANPFFYPVVFFSLYAAGLGAPISADLVLLTVGYLAFQGQADYAVLIPLAILGILLSDATMYLIAKKFGRRLTTIWPLKKALTPERLASAEKTFGEQGYRVVFLARFMPGVRTVFMFTSGLLRLNFWKFIAYDFAGALIVIPVTILSVKWLAGNLDAIRAHMEKGQAFVLGAAALALVIFLGFKFAAKKSVKKA